MTPKKKLFLITVPEHDEAMFYCAEWSNEIIDYAEERGFKVIRLSKEKVNRINFESYLKKQEPKFVMFNGHGGDDRIMGYDKEILLQKGENEEIMKNKLIYARSCSSLTELADACIDNGSNGFIGYSLPFTFISDPTRTAHPLKDEFAKPCLKTSNSVPFSLLKGNSISEAVEKAKGEMKALLIYWETRDDLVEAPYVATCLFWNMVGLGYRGKSSARL